MRFAKLSLQILVVFVAVVVLALGFSGWALTTLAQRIITDNVVQANQDLVLRIAEEVNLEMEEVHPALSLLAESDALQSLDPTIVASQLERYQSQFPVITAAYVADPDGYQIARTDGKALENVSSNYGFQVARIGNELISDVYLPKGGEGPTLTSYLPIRDGSEVIGVLVTDVNINRIQEILESLELGRDETVVVFAPNGRVVAHSRRTALVESLSLSDPALIEALVQAPAGILEDYTDELGRTVVGVHAPVQLGPGAPVPAGEADDVGQGAVQLGHLARPGCLVQTVDVLGDDLLDHTCGLQPRHRVMARVGTGLREPLPSDEGPRPVALPRCAAADELAELHRRDAAPTVRPAVVGDARVRRHPGTCEHQGRMLGEDVGHGAQADSGRSKRGWRGHDPSMR